MKTLLGRVMEQSGVRGKLIKTLGGVGGFAREGRQRTQICPDSTYEILRFGNQAGLRWIAFNVPADARELVARSHQMIVAFVLPEWLSRRAEAQVRLVRGEALQRSEPFCCGDLGRHQKVYMIRHDYEGVKLITVESTLAVMYRSDHQLSNRRNA